MHISHTVHKALRDPQWAQAIMDEMTALQKKNTWTLVQLPKEKRKVGILY